MRQYLPLLIGIPVSNTTPQKCARHLKLTEVSPANGAVVGIEIVPIGRRVGGSTSLFHHHLPEILGIRGLLGESEGHANDGQGWEGIAIAALSRRRTTM